MSIDIRLLTTFPRHPKTIKLIRLCGTDGVFSLITLWLWARENKPEGILEGCPEDIEIAAGWNGETNALFDALIEVKFLIKQDSGRVTFRNWSKHNPWAAGANERSLKAKKGGCAKHGKSCEKCTDDCLNSAQSCLEQKFSTAPSPSPSPLPSPLPLPKEKKIKHKHGELKHVFLTDEEYEKLLDKFGEEDRAHWIKTLDEGLDLKDYGYKSHYRAILKWHEKEQKEPKKKVFVS